MPKRPDNAMKPRLIDTQHRIKLPPEAMASMKVQPGDYVGVIIDATGVHLRKVEWSLR